MQDHVYGRARSIATTAVLVLAVLGPLVPLAPTAAANHCTTPHQTVNAVLRETLSECAHDTTQNKKDICDWRIRGGGKVPEPQDPTLTGNAQTVGPQFITLTCPNHGYLSEEGGVKGDDYCITREVLAASVPAFRACRAPAGAKVIKPLGQLDFAGTQCKDDWGRGWVAVGPNVNRYTVFLKVTLDKKDCQGNLLDWNKHKQEILLCTQDHGQITCQPLQPGQTCNNLPPGAFCQVKELPKCFIQNYFGPPEKDPKPGDDWKNWDQYPAPDGKYDECDKQTYEIQWTQWN